MNEVLTQFQGFHPSEFTRVHLDSILSEIQNEAPVGATVRAMFSRKTKIFSASIRVHSPAGHFFASAQGPHMRDVSQKALNRIRKQLNRWKTLRVQHQRLRDLPPVSA